MAGECYNINNAITIIATIIVSLLFGVITPVNYLGFNFPAQNQFSQIISQLPKKSLSEVDPIGSLGNVTAPLDNIWKALGAKLNNTSGLKDLLNKSTGAYQGPSKRALESRLAVGESSVTLGQMLGIAKSAVVLTAQILIAVMEIALWLLRGILGLIA